MMPPAPLDGGWNLYSNTSPPNPLSMKWRGGHPEGIHPEGDKGGEVEILRRRKNE